MKKQKICIVGDGLAGLTVALSLEARNMDIDLYYSKSPKDKKRDSRVTAISSSNFDFLREKIGISNKKLFFPCKKIQLYFESDNRFSNFLNFLEKKNLMYIFENKKIKNELIKKIKQKKIKLISKKIKKINFENNYIEVEAKKKKYDLFVLCLGARSNFYEFLNENRAIQKDYKEVSITGHLKHNCKFNNPSQFFLKEGPLAILPFKKNYFSFVWSLKKNYFVENKKNLEMIISKKFRELLKIKSFKITNINFYPIHLNLKKNYSKGNFLVLGEGLHSIHPIAGQGFNLILRDIIALKEIIYKNLSLGISIKNSFVLNEFFNKRKPENTIFSLGVDMTNSFFRTNLIPRSMKNLFLNEFSKYESLKKITKIVSNKGFY